MRPQHFAEVEIIRDDPQRDLRAGQRGYLLDWLPDPQGGEEGGIVELHDRSGHEDPTVTVPESWIQAVAEEPAKAQPQGKKRAS
jgi:hypothetical protein